MYMIEAIIRPEKLQEAKGVLDDAGFHGLTVTKVRGRGRQKGIKLQWRAGEYSVDLIEKIKLEIVVKADEVDRVVDLICGAVGTDNVGDGKIFIHELSDVVRIRTKEHGIKAI
ncbi:MAG: transcriptional regulator [Candidatus Altiarchaeales archaeon ex4484_96]|nr:MAG: transcriptional regulator [Candidatus Altiarchaeales archaeon ex4484_96]